MVENDESADAGGTGRSAETVASDVLSTPLFDATRAVTSDKKLSLGKPADVLATDETAGGIFFPVLDATGNQVGAIVVSEDGSGSFVPSAIARCS